MTSATFITKWRAVEFKKRSAAHSRFLDLCRMLGAPSTDCLAVMR